MGKVILKSLDSKPVEVSVNLGIKINENLGARILGMIKGKNLLEIKIAEKFIGERGRINCSLKENDGFWRWLGIQYVVSDK